MDEIKDLKTLAEWVKTCPMIELPYIIEKLDEYKKALYMHSKFKVGDRVVLVKEPVINEITNCNLMGDVALFKNGAIAIIEDVIYQEGFAYRFRFETENQHTFYLREEYFELAKNKVCSECHRGI